MEAMIFFIIAYKCSSSDQKNCKIPMSKAKIYSRHKKNV